MGVVEKDGRARSERTTEESADLIRAEFNGMTDEEKETVIACLKEMGDPTFEILEQEEGKVAPPRIIDVISEAEYKYKPVDIETFVKDDYYLGRTAKGLYPKLLEDLKELFSGGYREAVITGSIGFGKTFFSSIAACRILYEISCLRDPHESLGIAKGTGIAFVVISVTEDLAIKVAFDNIATKIKESPYFQDNFPFKIMKKEMHFPNDVMVVGRAPTMNAALGLNVMSAFLDECLMANSAILMADGREVPVCELVDVGPFSVSTFDFSRNIPVISDAYAKKSSDQKCYEVSLANGEVLGTSWNHPIAVKTENGIEFRLMDDISVGDEVVTYGYESKKNRQFGGKQPILREEAFFGRQGNTVRESKKEDGEEKSFLREETYRKGEEEAFGGGEKESGLEAYRRDKEEGIVGAKGEGCVEGDRGKNKEENAGEAGFRMETDPGYPNARPGQPKLWEEAYDRNQKEDVRGREREEGKRRDKEEDVGDAQREARALGGVQKETCRKEQEAQGEVQAHGGDKAENFQIQHMEDEEGGLSIPWLCRNEKGREDRVSEQLGTEGGGNSRSRKEREGVQVRASGYTLYVGGEEEVDLAGFPCHLFKRQEGDSGGETEGVYGERQREGKIRRCNKILQGARLGIRDMDRVLSVDRVLSKRDLGVQSTYDIHVPGYETMVANSALVHNTNFIPSVKKKGIEARVGDVGGAQTLYNQLITRMKSRFMNKGKMPGMMLVVSSKQTKDDFTKKRILESKNDPSVFAIDYSTWDVRPDKFGKERFQVLVGNEKVPSKILEPDEVETVREDLQEGMLVIDVPVEYRSQFENDIDASLRDIAGVETVTVSPFIQRRDKIIECIDPSRVHPFSTESWVQTESGGVHWNRLAKLEEVRDGANVEEVWQPTFYPGMTRHIHIDPSINTDATGFSVGCVTGYVNVERTDPNTGEKFVEPAPHIWVDFTLQIVPPVGGEIDYGMIRDLVYQFQNHGFHIGLVTLDQFQSTSMIQTFNRKGINSERLSVDKPIDAYETLKSAVYENRVSYYSYEPLLKELREIKKDNVKNKVDHERGKSKDCSDSLAGIVYTLSTMYNGPPLGIIKGLSKHSDPALEEQQDIVDESKFFMPFIQG